MTGRTEPLVGDPELRTEAIGGVMGYDILIYNIDDESEWVQSTEVVNLGDMR